MCATGKKLLFVYNADSGLFNTLTDIAHKLLSPASYPCSLCAITHSALHERKEWTSFIQSLEIESIFLHRDEFQQQFPGRQWPLPAIFLLDGKELRCCLSAESISQCSDMPQLQEALRKNCCR